MIIYVQLCTYYIITSYIGRCIDLELYAMASISIVIICHCTCKAQEKGMGQ